MYKLLSSLKPVPRKVTISQLFIKEADRKKKYFTFCFKAFYNMVLSLDKLFYWFSPHTAIQRNKRQQKEDRKQWRVRYAVTAHLWEHCHAIYCNSLQNSPRGHIKKRQSVLMRNYEIILKLFYCWNNTRSPSPFLKFKMKILPMYWCNT